MSTQTAGGVNGSAPRNHFSSCTQVSAQCPVAATTLGYYPNRGINYFFAIAFGLAGIATLVVGVRKKTWSYMAFITAGCMLEMAGGFLPSRLRG